MRARGVRPSWVGTRPPRTAPARRLAQVHGHRSVAPRDTFSSRGMLSRGEPERSRPVLHRRRSWSSANDARRSQQPPRITSLAETRATSGHEPGDRDHAAGSKISAGIWRGAALAAYSVTTGLTCVHSPQIRSRSSPSATRATTLNVSSPTSTVVRGTGHEVPETNRDRSGLRRWRRRPAQPLSTLWYASGVTRSVPVFRPVWWTRIMGVPSK